MLNIMRREKKTFGLIGKNISYSFSKKFFSKKFDKLNLEKSCEYKNFDLNHIKDFKTIIKKYNIHGLNVTIPYKEEVLKYLDEIDVHAQKIGAVNTIKVDSKGFLKGFNTDYIGFYNSIKKNLNNVHKKALVLGTGGASKAIVYGLKKLQIQTTIVSRSKAKGCITYKEINSIVMGDHQIIINCTPLGTSPNTSECPDIPYKLIGKSHLCFDLIYNPDISQFLKKSKKNNASIINGAEMLEQQAEESWKIWNN